jgi:hypothetical protein
VRDYFVLIAKHQDLLQTGERLLCTNSKAPGPVIKIGQSETGRSGRSYSLHSSIAVLFTSLSEVCKNASPKPFLLSQTHMFQLFFLDFNLRGHILITTGVALTKRAPPNGKLPQKAKITLTIEGEGKETTGFLNIK